MAGAFSAMVTTISRDSCFQESSTPSVTITWEIVKKKNKKALTRLYFSLSLSLSLSLSSPPPDSFITSPSISACFTLPWASVLQYSQSVIWGTWDSGQLGQWMPSSLHHCPASGYSVQEPVCVTVDFTCIRMFRVVCMRPCTYIDQNSWLRTATESKANTQ